MKRTGVFVGLFSTVAIVAVLYLAPRFPSTAELKLSEKNQNPATSLDAKVARAIELLQSGEVPPMQAIGMIREVLEEDPDHYPALLSLGLMSLQTGQYDKAVLRLERLLPQDSTNPEVLKALGDAYLGMGDSTNASDTYRIALEYVQPGSEAAAELNQLLASLE